ncbi:hypothetical protein [Oryzobacter terrae]|uniref:hypothetical protein n=1 Tax=Oryzobacter terrae TaxID=1620385 RepID=UPI003671B5F1
MERFEDVLAVGGRSNSLGRAAEVLDVVRADPSRTDELFACISAEDPWVRMRAVDTFEKLVREDPERGRPYTERVVSDLTRSPQASVQWHVAQLVDLLELTGAQRTGAITWLRERLATTDVDWIVAAQAMTTLVSFVEGGHVDAADLDTLLAVQETHPSASVRRKATRFREALRERT